MEKFGNIFCWFDYYKSKKILLYLVFKNEYIENSNMKLSLKYWLDGKLLYNIFLLRLIYF